MAAYLAAALVPAFVFARRRGAAGVESGEALRLDGVTIRLPERTLVRDFTLASRPGECVTVMGPSGCGKSTLLAYRCGNARSRLPRVRPRADRRSRRHARSAGNAAHRHPVPGRSPVSAPFGRRQPRLRAASRTFATARRAGPASTRRSRRPTCTASRTATRRRCRAVNAHAWRSCARCLSEPEALLLDEPFNKLDAQLRADFRRFVFDHAAQRGLPVLLVTHDAADAPPAGGQVVDLAPL